jgi:Homocysteine S-methyltransferase
MERYGRLAVHAGARIIGGCCGTSPEHLAAIRRGVDQAIAEVATSGRQAPSIETIVADIGKLSHQAPSSVDTPAATGKGGRRRRE